MITVVIPSHLRHLHADASLTLEAGRVREVLTAIEARVPGFRDALGPEFAVAIDGEILNDPWLEPVDDGSELHFLPPLSGG